MPKRQSNSSVSVTTGEDQEPLDPILEQLERDGPEAQAARAVNLLSQKPSKEDSLREKLYEDYGQELVDNIAAQFPQMSMSTLQEQLGMHY